MRAYLTKTIAALTSELASSLDAGRGSPEASYDDVVQFVLEQLNRMPWFLRLGVQVCTAAFAVSVFLSGGYLVRGEKTPHALARVKAWRQSKSPIRRNLMKFYTSLVVLSLYSRAGADRSNSR